MKSRRWTMLRGTAVFLAVTAVLSAACDAILTPPQQLPTPESVSSQRVRPGLTFGEIVEPLLSLGKRSRGENVKITVRSCERVNLLLVDSIGTVLSGAVLDPPDNGEFCLFPSASACFAIDTPDTYFLYLLSDASDGSFGEPVSASFSLIERCDRPVGPPCVRVRFAGMDQVTLSHPLRADEYKGVRSELCAMDLGIFADFDLRDPEKAVCHPDQIPATRAQKEKRDFLRQVQPLTESLIVERLDCLLKPLGVDVDPPDPRRDCSTVYFTNKRGDRFPESAFETVCRTAGTGGPCILYGEAGRDFGNTIPDDVAIVYVGSFTEDHVTTSLGDLVNLLAHTAAHEIGHLLGLVHVGAIGDIMRGRFSVAYRRDLQFTPSHLALDNGVIPFLLQDPCVYAAHSWNADPLPCASQGPSPGDLGD